MNIYPHLGPLLSDVHRIQLSGSKQRPETMDISKNEIINLIQQFIKAISKKKGENLRFHGGIDCKNIK